MKILIDLTALDDNFSGIERFALNISKNIIMKDNKNEYILLFKNRIHNEFVSMKLKSNVNLKIIYGKNRFLFNQIILPLNLYKIKVDKYLFLAFPGPILFKRKGIINTIHDLTCWDYPNTMKVLSKYYFRILIRNAFKQSESILTVSEFSKKRIINKFGKSKKINIIYNGVSSVFLNYNKEESYKYKIDLPKKYLLSLGTLEPRKNIKLLIKAYTKLKQNYDIEHKLVLVGRNGWKNNDLFNSIDKDIKESIIFTGFLDDKVLPYVYDKADIFVFPSIYEGFGIPLIEAMSVGTKIVYSDIDVLQEITNSVGISFKSNNLNDLIEKIKYSMNNEELNKVNLINQSNKFRWDKEAMKLILLFEEV
ncbi:glycosyltransferase family 4 protein [Clostridium perfringens]|uniref:glycosyltransferase family 4 protein n=1 Tax=Clostridium perfringens TaxID=1502 RepID=UPI00234123A0|nr:glycosyltransferase family 1 protein [Clostridium perfringens]ELC8386904.1 glycosyltransferase family 4 protein [Clostridium perfringens]ELC8407914.1 glycosyltransferase family 4 protein [Clostridium perfringens]MDC4244638.1 glycosyltransferase family 4 protein [Clostridium perfringens]MDK0917025.1 glycosyltransferase family 1 protein [Clostridium perfringens]